MRRHAPTVIAAAVSLLLYAGAAWLVSGIDIPDDVPTARMPWIWPFRVVSVIGFTMARFVHIPHLAGNLLAALLLGGVLGAAFGVARLLARSAAAFRQGQR